jgi:hypothetical protein
LLFLPSYPFSRPLHPLFHVCPFPLCPFRCRVYQREANR